jgi:hypothetical protein
MIKAVAMLKLVMHTLPCVEYGFSTAVLAGRADAHLA